MKLLLFIASLAVATHSFAATVTYTPTFNEPQFGVRSTVTVERKLIDLINQAPAGSTVRVAEYILARKPVARALVLASERGADVQLVLDGKNEHYTSGSAVDILLHGFNGHRGIEQCSDQPCVKFCHGPLSPLGLNKGQLGGSCHGVVINHNKFFLFSRIADRTNVVVQTTANIDQYQLHKYNDLVEIDNDSLLYAGYYNYWMGLKRDHTRLTTPGDFKGENGTRVYTFPRLIGKDPVARLLRRVSCQIPGSSIRLAQSDFGRSSVAKQLARLRSEGCDVRLLAVDDPELKQPVSKVRNIMGSSMALIYNRYQDPSNSIHTKMILINASLDGSPTASKIVLTGSHNLDQFSEKMNDETLLEIHNAELFDAYSAFWERMVHAAEGARLVSTL